MPRDDLTINGHALLGADEVEEATIMTKSQQELTPEVPRKKGKATSETLTVGCFAMVHKDGEYRKAEILGTMNAKKDGSPRWYCNFVNFNKRLDEWVPASRIDFSQDVEWPIPEAEKPKETKKVNQKNPTNRKNSQKRPQSEHTRAVSVASEGSNNPLQESQATSSNPKNEVETPTIGNGEDRLETEMDMADTPDADKDEMDLDEPAAEKGPKKYSEQEEKEEKEKLRYTGSMTQNPGEIHRMKNISAINLGREDIPAWYYSPYPEEFKGEPLIYICEFCLSYYADEYMFRRHRTKCTLQHPPGNEIYRDQEISFFEIDGKRQRTYARNLCLLSKLFLDHKTLYYDVDPFLFYVMTKQDGYGHHIIGYFSKEKESADNYNVACILTLPQYQRMGYGRLLIQFSYELSKIENKYGSPEKPLSDLGLLSYRQYWTEAILDIIIPAQERQETVTVEMLMNTLAMTQADIDHCLRHNKILAYMKSDYRFIIPKKLDDFYKKSKEKEKIKPKRKINPDLILWKPPVFTRTWGW